MLSAASCLGFCLAPCSVISFCMLCEYMSIIALSEMNHCEILEEKIDAHSPYFQICKSPSHLTPIPGCITKYFRWDTKVYLSIYLPIHQLIYVICVCVCVIPMSHICDTPSERIWDGHCILHPSSFSWELRR